MCEVGRPHACDRAACEKDVCESEVVRRPYLSFCNECEGGLGKGVWGSEGEREGEEGEEEEGRSEGVHENFRKENGM